MQKNMQKENEQKENPQQGALSGENAGQKALGQEILRAEDVSFRYPSMGHNALEHVSFSVYERDFLAIIGPNGGGKSTLIKLLLGLLTPTQGQILYPAAHIFSPLHSPTTKGKESVKTAKPLVGYVPQDTNINADFPISVLDVVLMGLMERRMFGFRPSKIDRAKAYEALEKLEIAHLANRAIAELSGGQRQRALIARAISAQPRLLVLDEPTSSVDSKMQAQIYKSLKKINNFHTIILISHHISVLLGYANRALFVDKEVIEHTIPRMQSVLDTKGHICEVDLFDKLCTKV